MTVFISGGCKNGKSTVAQEVAKKLSDGERLYYLATMIPHDSEDEKRIRRHLLERDGWGFETVECGRNILSAFDKATASGTFLLDSVTALLANEMFLPDGTICRNACDKLCSELSEFATRAANVVFVSDYIYSDAAKYDKITELYRCGLAQIDRRLASQCDAVAELCGSNTIIHKGELP